MKRNATLDPNLAKHPDGGVPLSAADKKALVAFLRTLTDERLRNDNGEKDSYDSLRITPLALAIAHWLTSNEKCSMLNE